MEQSPGQSLPRADYPCPVCANTDTTTLLMIGDFHIVQCTTCAMVYVNPRVQNENIFSIYRNDYFHREGGESGYAHYELDAPLRIRTYHKWYALLQRHLSCPPGNALDIGCAAGYFLDLLKEKGWPSVEGIELDRRMFSQLRQRGLNVSFVPLEHFVPSHRYHLITLFDVVEHLPEINFDFAKMVSMLDDNGIIALVTPNFACLQRKLFGKRWFQFKPLEHIYYFTPATLKLLAEKRGLSIVHLSAAGQFADFDFLCDRLSKYRFSWFGKAFRVASTLLHLKKKFWYINTGSMFAVLKKKHPTPLEKSFHYLRRYESKITQ